MFDHHISPPRLLILEDETDLRDAMVTYFQIEGFYAVGVGNISLAEEMMNRQDFDILLLDLGLPDGDGLLWLQGRRDLADKGLVIVTARDQSPDKLAGLSAGADLYLVKPVALPELVLHVRNLYRRLARVTTRKVESATAEGWTYKKLHWLLCAPGGGEIKLTHSESVLMGLLASAPGQPVSKHDIILALDHNPDYYNSKRLEILIRRLRSKVFDRLGLPLPLETVHALGYAFVAPVVVI